MSHLEVFSRKSSGVGSFVTNAKGKKGPVATIFRMCVTEGVYTTYELKENEGYSELRRDSNTSSYKENCARNHFYEE